MITIFTPSFADEADTNAQNLSVKEIVSRLDPNRFEVTMLYQGAPDPRIAERPNTHLLRWRKQGNTIRILIRLLARVSDVYFFPREGPLDAAFLNLRRYLNLRTAVVTHVVSGGLDAGSYGPARIRNIRDADLVLANNTYLAELLKSKLGIGAGTIHNGLDRRHFFPNNRERIASERVTVLYAGSMRPYKRVPFVVKEAAKRTASLFRIAGTGEEERLCRNMAQELGCKNIQFLGHLSPAQLGEEMRAADIFLFPSCVEGHPQVLGQAAACGLPVAAMRVYRPDYVVNGMTGYLADNDRELTEKLDLLIRNSELRRVMGRAAIEHAQKFNWDNITELWQNAFESAVAKRQHH